MKRRLLIGVGIALAIIVVVGVAGLLAIDRSGYRYRTPDLSLSSTGKADRLKLEARFTKPPAKENSPPARF